MDNSQHRWHLLGAGSLGCLFAAHLQRAGVCVELIVRDEATLQQLHANGGITLLRGNHRETVAIAAATPDAVAAPIAQLLVCTKAHQTLAAIERIRPKIAADATIVLLQNGMGVRELLAAQLPDAAILHALSTEGAFRTQRFHVTHAGRGETFIGAIDSRHADCARRIAQALRCDLNIAYAADIERRLWLKLAVNAAINPLSAIHRCRNGELLALDTIDDVIAQLCEELAQVAQAEHIDLDSEQMRAEILRVMRATAHNKSSMLQDVEAQRATEIDFISGFIVQRARAHGLPCAQHAHLLAAVHALQP